MLLVCDIGNINIDLGIYKENNLECTFRINSYANKTSDEYGITLVGLLNNFNIDKKDITGVIIASAVPDIMHSFVSCIIKYLNIEPLIVGPGIKSGVSIHYDNPKEIGADRIATCAGAISEYGNDLLIIDFSTATTFEYIDNSGNYKGGVIAPGISVSIDALSKKAAKLPSVDIRECSSVLANDTVSAMQAGTYLGYLGMVEYLIDRFKKETNTNLKVIATGGIGKLFAKNSSKIDVYDSDLSFKGLKNIYYRNRKI